MQSWSVKQHQADHHHMCCASNAIKQGKHPLNHRWYTFFADQSDLQSMQKEQYCNNWLHSVFRWYCGRSVCSNFGYGLDHSVANELFNRRSVIRLDIKYWYKSFQIWGDDRRDGKYQRLTTAATKLMAMVLCHGVVGNLKALFSEDRQERIPWQSCPVIFGFDRHANHRTVC